LQRGDTKNLVDNAVEVFKKELGFDKKSDTPTMTKQPTRGGPRHPARNQAPRKQGRETKSVKMDSKRGLNLQHSGIKKLINARWEKVPQYSTKRTKDPTSELPSSVFKSTSPRGAAVLANGQGVGGKLDSKVQLHSHGLETKRKSNSPGKERQDRFYRRYSTNQFKP